MNIYNNKNGQKIVIRCYYDHSSMRTMWLISVPVHAGAVCDGILDKTGQWSSYLLKAIVYIDSNLNVRQNTSSTKNQGIFIRW